MARKIIFFLILISCFPLSGQENPKRYYMGQKPPGDQPQIFAPGFISTAEDEIFGTFAPDLDEFYYIHADEDLWIIMVTKYINGEWTAPERAPFSVNFISKFCLAPCGNKVILTSIRPRPGTTVTGSYTTTWISERIDNTWTEPKYIPGLDSAFAPSMAINGNLYFQKMGEPQQDIYVSEYKGGKYLKPNRMDAVINSKVDEADPWIAPDESYMLFSREYKESTGLFISYRSGISWTEAIPLGSGINAIKPVNAGSVTPDGRYIMLFSNYVAEPGNNTDGAGRGSIDIYWVRSDIISILRPGTCTIEKVNPGVISLHERNEGNLTYSSRYRTFIYRTFDPGSEDPLKLMLYSKKGISEVQSIDSRYREWDFNFDRSGKHFYFTSDRPMTGVDSIPLPVSKIWQVRFNNGKWGKPSPLPYPVNKDDVFSGYPTFSNNNRIYFHSKRNDGQGNDDIYYCNYSKNYFSLPINPGHPVNTKYSDRDPAISPDDSIIVFFSDRPGGTFYDGDLYLCSRQSSDSWNKPMPLGGLIGYAGHPYISDDGKVLFFTGYSGTDTDIYKVAIDSLLNMYTLFLKFRPDSVSELIAPGIISSEDDEVPLCITDNNLLVISRTQPGFSDWENEPLYITHFNNQSWTTPLRIDYADGPWVKNLPDSSITGILVFSQPDKNSDGSYDLSINICSIRSDGKIEVSRPGSPVNTEFTDSWPVVDHKQNLCFFSDRPGGHGSHDLYFSRNIEGSYNSVTNMGPDINTRWKEHDPAISKDGRILIFASDRDGGFGGDDLYACFKLDSGRWSNPINLGSDINSQWDENRPVIFGKGRMLLFTSNKSGNLDIYKSNLK